MDQKRGKHTDKTSKGVPAASSKPEFEFDFVLYTKPMFIKNKDKHGLTLLVNLQTKKDNESVPLKRLF